MYVPARWRQYGTTPSAAVIVVLGVVGTAFGTNLLGTWFPFVVLVAVLAALLGDLWFEVQNLDGQLEGAEEDASTLAELQQQAADFELDRQRWELGTIQAEAAKDLLTRQVESLRRRLSQNSASVPYLVKSLNEHMTFVRLTRLHSKLRQSEWLILDVTLYSDSAVGVRVSLGDGTDGLEGQPVVLHDPQSDFISSSAELGPVQGREATVMFELADMPPRLRDELEARLACDTDRMRVQLAGVSLLSPYTGRSDEELGRLLTALETAASHAEELATTAKPLQVEEGEA